jgi:hypothetical protein
MNELKLNLNQEVTNLFLSGGTLVKSCISSDEKFFVGVVKMPKNNLANDNIYKTKRKFEFVMISNYIYNSEIVVTSYHNQNMRKVKSLCTEQYEEDIQAYRRKIKSIEFVY